MFYTYVLMCESLSRKPELYIGFTSNLGNRISEHKSMRVTATKEYYSLELVYYEACRSKTDALKREKSLKSGFGRAFLKNRLQSESKLRD